MTDRSLSLLLEFDSRAKRDQGQSPVFLHRRDRKFALTCEQQNINPSAERWIAHMDKLSGVGSIGNACKAPLRLFSRINRGFALVGAILGVFTMLGLLFYDGGQRINVTIILAFVTFQCLLAVFTTLQSVAGWQPWRSVLKRFQKHEEPRVFTKLHGVLMAKAAQLGGLCFASSGLLTLLIMVVLQDLAFGWSTTLESNASAYHSLISSIAAPWSWLWPAAVPDLALVEATRFFRAGDAENTINPVLWGQWWPFIVMLWATWAWLPRGILYLLAGVIIRRKAKHLLNSHPAMHALLYRMETPSLDTGNENNDANDLPNTNTELSVQPLPSSNAILYWAGASQVDLAQISSLNNNDKSGLFEAKIGGRMSLAQDENTLAEMALKLVSQAQANVIIVTCSWEPPTGELEDFIIKAEQQWPKNSRVFLLPLATNQNKQPSAQLVQQWLRFAKRCHPNFVAVSLVGEGKNKTSKQIDAEQGRHND